MSIAYIISLLGSAWSVVKGSRFFWGIIKHYGVLKENLQAIGNVIKAVMESDRKVPSCEEGQILLRAISNILKTQVIDLPGLDEYELAVSIDEITGTLVCQLTDKASSKVFKLAGGKIK